MRRDGKPRRGDGTGWLVADRLKGDYLCYWYVGQNGDHLAESARVPTATDALAWARLRTTRVRIRTGEAHTYWAGSAPRPEGVCDTWTEPAATHEPDETSRNELEDAGRSPTLQTPDTIQPEQRQLAAAALASRGPGSC